MVHPILRRPKIRAGLSQLGGHVRHDVNLRLAHLNPGGDPRELLEHRLHQRRMKRMGDGQRADPPALLSQTLRDRAHCGLCAGDHHRFGTVDRRDRHSVTQQRRHLAFTNGHRDHGSARRQALHQPAPRGDQHRRVRQLQHPRHICRRQLPHRMTHHKIRAQTPAPQQREQRRLNREQRRLGELRAVEQTLIITPDNSAQRQSQMPIQRIGRCVKSVGERRQLVIQLAAHPNRLRTLPRENHHRLAYRGRPAHHHAVTRLFAGDPGQPRDQLLAISAHRHRSMLKHRPPRQRPPDIGRVQMFVSLHVGQQSARLRGQCLSRSSRDHPGQRRQPHSVRFTGNCCTADTFGRLGGGFLQDHMSVGAADPERGHAGPARMPVGRPVASLGQHRHLPARPIHVRGRNINVQRRRHHPIAHRLHHLDDSSHTGRGLSVSHIRFDRAQPQRPPRRPVLAIGG